jgi:hypothetical protein
MDVDTTSLKMKEEWGVVGKKDGSQQMLAMPASFGLCASADEALYRAEMRMKNDPEFRAKFRGWTFYPIRCDKAVSVDPTGVVLIYKNERQSILGVR